MSLQKIVELYKLTHNNHEFWTPYWINESGAPEGIFRGKGSPEQIKIKLAEILDQYADPLDSGEEVRYLMYRNSLGIDCSGFIFHVLNRYLADSNINLTDHLYVSKTDLEKAAKKESWRKQHELSQKEIAGLDDTIKLAWVCERFDKPAQDLVDVARLCNPMAAMEVKVEDLKPGDMVRLDGKYGNHVWLITEADDQVTYAESKFDPVGPGGVAVNTVDLKFISEKPEFVGVYRLKVMNGG